MLFPLSFLFVALFVFPSSFVSARPRLRRSPSPVDSVLAGLTTNAKRFASGLPPLPPVRRWIGTPVDAARRTTPSLVPRVGEIEVYDTDGKLLGWVSDDLKHDGRFRLANAHHHAKKFTANLATVGTTYPVNFKLTDLADTFLAGLVDPGKTIGPTSGVGILGWSGPVPFGPPTVNDPSISNDPSETALWTYDAGTGNIAPIWIDQGATSLFLWYDNPAHTFYLTGSPAPPTEKSDAVTFRFVFV